MKLSNEDRLLWYCAQSGISEGALDKVRDLVSRPLNWEEIFTSASRHGIAPLLYNRLKGIQESHLIPKEAVDKLRKSYYENVARNMGIYAELDGILQVFRDKGVEVIILKGAALANSVYGNIGLRPMSDVDILTKKEDLPKAVELLFQMGYGLCENPDVHKQNIDIQELINSYSRHVPALSHPQGIQKLDIHWTMPDSPSNINTGDLWERAITVEMNKTEARVLSIEDLLLHLSLHTSVHHKFHFHGIKQLYDIAITMNRYCDEIDWDRLRLRAYEWRAEKYLYLTLRLSREILGAKVPEGILHALKPESFNEKILLEAQNRILFQKSGESDKKFAFEGIPHLDKFHPDNNLSKRISFISKRIFIPPEELANRYSLPTASGRVYLYYFIRLISRLYYYIPRYVPFFLYLLTQRKNSPYVNDLDFWLIPSDSEEGSNSAIRKGRKSYRMAE